MTAPFLSLGVLAQPAAPASAPIVTMTRTAVKRLGAAMNVMPATYASCLPGLPGGAYRSLTTG
jgi:hypothetical protein